MRKQFNLQLMNLIVLMSVLMVLPACKKSKEPISSLAATVVTNYAANVSQTWATLEGGVTANNLSTIVTFDYDTTTSYKQSINATPDTINGIPAACKAKVIDSAFFHLRIRITG